MKESELLKLFPWLRYIGTRSERGGPKGLCTLCCEYFADKSKFGGQHGGDGAVIKDGNILTDHQGSVRHRKAAEKAFTIPDGAGNNSNI